MTDPWGDGGADGNGGGPPPARGAAASTADAARLAPSAWDEGGHR
eukprot:gene32919-15318_t